jgi:hypothetical protein
VRPASTAADGVARAGALAVPVVLAGLLLAGCSGGGADAAHAVVLRHLIEQHELLQPVPEGAAAPPRYLLVEQAAPSQAFVDRFADCSPPPVAASAETHDLIANAARPGPAEAGLTLWVAHFDQRGEGHGNARGGWYGPGDAREEFRYELRRDGGIWSVASAVRQPASAEAAGR